MQIKTVQICVSDIYQLVNSEFIQLLNLLILNQSNTQRLNKFKILLYIPSLCCIAVCKIKTSTTGEHLSKKTPKPAAMFVAL